ncbi:MAG: hypothetical protein II920_00470 [Clostridia bacterium]|nr:hypothetical protein [Clostridia bacterium]
MKRFVSALIVLALMLSACALGEGGFDFTPFTSMGDFFVIYMDEENYGASVDINFSPEMTAFTHKYESDYYYSTMVASLFIDEYSSPAAKPELVTVITYFADEPLNISSVSFIIGGREYVFTDETDEGDPPHIREVEHGTRQLMVIEHGANNIELTQTIMTQGLLYCYALADETSDAPLPELKIVLHGTEDVEFVPPESYWMSLGMFYRLGIMYDFAEDLLGAEGDECTVKAPDADAAAPAA